MKPLGLLWLMVDKIHQLEGFLKAQHFEFVSGIHPLDPGHPEDQVVNYLF
jgi:hypothetical protein